MTSGSCGAARQTRDRRLSQAGKRASVLAILLCCFVFRLTKKSFRLGFSFLLFQSQRKTLAATAPPPCPIVFFSRWETGRHAKMSKGGEESSGGGPWLAPESERGVCHQSAEEAEIIDRVVPIVAASASSARPVSQLLGALSLSREVVEECPTTIHGRSISFADGLASLASGEEASPARSATGAASTSSSCSSKHYQQQQSWPGFANVCGSPALSCGVGDNWVEAIDRAIAEMVRREFPRREKLKTKGKRKEREVFFLTFSHLEPCHAPSRPRPPLDRPLRPRRHLRVGLLGRLCRSFAANAPRR